MNETYTATPLFRPRFSLTNPYPPNTVKDLSPTLHSRGHSRHVGERESGAMQGNVQSARREALAQLSRPSCSRGTSRRVGGARRASCSSCDVHGDGARGPPGRSARSLALAGGLGLLVVVVL